MENNKRKNEKQIKRGASLPLGVYAIIGAFIVAIICFFIILFNIKKSSINNLAFPKLEENIGTIETAIGDYSDFYIKIESSKNDIIHDIGTTDINNDKIFVIPSDLGDEFIIDFYTCWDENLGSYYCDFDKNESYIVKGKTIKLVKSKLPFVFINITKNDLNKVNSSYTYENSKKEKAYITISTYENSNKLTIPATLSPRGSSSWTLYNKKPYGIKFEKSYNAFNLISDKKFNMLANGFDKTLLKNELFFYLGDRLNMKYTPMIKNVNMYFNDSYQGVYSITTKIKVGKNTIDLSDGDFLFCWGSSRIKHKIDYSCDFWTADVDETMTGRDSSFIDLEWPETEPTNPILEKNVQKVVQNYVDILEGRKDGDLSECLDMEDMAKYYWVQEIMMNSDAWYRSAFMYYDHTDHKLHMGPLWDGDRTLNTTNSKQGIDFTNPTGWKIRTAGYYVPLFENDEFVNEVNRVYYDYNIEEIMYDSYEEFTKNIDELSIEGELNYQLWKEEQSNVDADDYKTNKTYIDYCNKKKEFYRQRIDWIAEEMRK